MVQYRMKQLKLKKVILFNELSEKTEVSKPHLSYIERGIQKNLSLHHVKTSRLFKYNVWGLI